MANAVVTYGPLRQVVLAQTGQDVRRCAHCSFCAGDIGPDEDLSLESLLELVVMNDDEALTSTTLWSDRALEAARRNCAGNLDMAAVMMALREEAFRRGIVG